LFGSACSAKVFCSVKDDAGLFTPTLRILLNTRDPGGIKTIHQNYQVLACETQAVTMMNDEDSGVKIKLLEQKEAAKPDNCFDHTTVGRTQERVNADGRRAS
jgi:hypothetical protein